MLVGVGVILTVVQRNIEDTKELKVRVLQVEQAGTYLARHTATEVDRHDIRISRLENELTATKVVNERVETKLSNVEKNIERVLDILKSKH